MVQIKNKLSSLGFWKRQAVSLFSWALFFGLIVLVYWLWPRAHSPVPKSIQVKVSYSLVYPGKVQFIQQNSWQYEPKDNTVTYQVKTPNYSAVITEQATPLAYRDDQAAYQRFVGSLRPKANFNTPLGTVSVVNFVTQSDFSPTGEAGILNTHGTLVIVHPLTDFTEANWFDLFDSLKVGH